MKKVAVSACLLGYNCRYDATSRANNELIELLEDSEIISFCPEDFCFGSPRPTMDLIEFNSNIKAISNTTKADLSPPIKEYAKAFFDTHKNIELFIGKDRSPSCGVYSAKLYSKEKLLINQNSTGLMAQEAINQGIKSIDAEVFINENLDNNLI